MGYSGKLDIEDILSKFETCEDFWGEVYKRGAEDADFVLGDQWQQKAKQMRKNRPCLVDNRMLPFVHQVINGIRQARPSIIPKPVNDGANEETAEVLRGIIRNIETTSDGDNVYDTAARNSVMSSVGWIRICTDYAGHDTFDQEVRLERIQNFQSVYLDPNHQRQDGSDAKYGFAFVDMDKDEFKNAYPDATQEGFTKTGWADDKTIRIAEYFYKDYEEKELAEYEFLTLAGVSRGIAFADKVPPGAHIVRTRKTSVCKIKYAKLTCEEILEEGEFPGEYIPLVPVYGFEAFTNDRRMFYSLIHQAKDTQRMLNYWKSASAEVVALQPKAPFIGARGQFTSFAKQWASANQENYPFLEYDPVLDDAGNPLPPPQRQAPVTSSGSLMQEAMAAADGIKAALGMYDASLGQQTPDVSGKAIISRQMQGDNATFHFVDNLSVAIRHVGRILIGIIPIVYSGPRIVRIMGEDGKEVFVPLNQPVGKVGKQFVNPQQGVETTVISLDAGKYDVVVEVGASYATKRQEAANAIIEIARVNPAILNVAGDILVRALDIPNNEEMAKRIRATMPPELLGDDVEAQRLQSLTTALSQLQEKLTLTEQALLAKQQDAEFKNSLEAKKVENETKDLMIKAALTEAQIAKIQAEINQQVPGAMDAVAEALSDLHNRVSDVAGALDVLLAHEEGEATGEPESPDNEGNDYAGRPDIGSGPARE